MMAPKFALSLKAWLWASAAWPDIWHQSMDLQDEEADIYQCLHPRWAQSYLVWRLPRSVPSPRIILIPVCDGRMYPLWSLQTCLFWTLPHLVLQSRQDLFQCKIRNTQPWLWSLIVESGRMHQHGRYLHKLCMTWIHVSGNVLQVLCKLLFYHCPRKIYLIASRWGGCQGCSIYLETNSHEDVGLTFLGFIWLDSRIHQGDKLIENGLQCIR